MKKLFRKLFRHPEPSVRTKVVIVKRDASRLSLAEWRADPNLVRAAKKILDSSDFRIMLDIVRNENPINQVFVGKVSMEDRGIHQAYCEGYSVALNTLERLAQATREIELGDPTWEDPLTGEPKLK